MTKLQAFTFRCAMTFFGYVAAVLAFGFVVFISSSFTSAKLELRWFELPLAVMAGLPLLTLMILVESLKTWIPLAFIAAAVLRIRSRCFYALLGAAAVAYALSAIGFSGLVAATVRQPLYTALFLASGAISGLTYWAVACRLADRLAQRSILIAGHGEA